MSNPCDLLKSSRISAIYSVSNIEVNSDRRQHEINRALAEQITEVVLASGRVEVSRLEYSTEYRLGVFVLTGEALHRLINEEAMRLSSMISRNMNIPRNEP